MLAVSVYYISTCGFKRCDNFAAPGKMAVHNAEVSTTLSSFGIGATICILQKMLWSPVCVILLSDRKRVLSSVSSVGMES